MKECEVCGCEFAPNSNRQKYCTECKKIVLRKQRVDATDRFYKKKFTL